MTRRDWLKAIIAVPFAAVVPTRKYGLFNPRGDIAGQYAQSKLAFHPHAFSLVMDPIAWDAQKRWNNMQSSVLQTIVVRRD